MDKKILWHIGTKMKSFNDYKYCPGCECVYPVEFFHSHSATVDGLRVYCIECRNRIERNYNESHKKERAAYRESHKKERSAYSRKRYKIKKKEIDAKQKKYQQKYPEVSRRIQHKRRLKKQQLSQSYTLEQWKDKVDATNGICPQCNRIYDDVYPFCVTMDHAPSISIAPVGFCYTINDVFPICGSCNSSNHVHSNDNTNLENFGL
jgi:hypothetical protein